MEPLPIITQRRIEAKILGNVYEMLKARFGKQEAREMLREIISKAAVEQGKEFAAQLDHAPDLADFREALQHWTRDNALEIDILASDTDRLSFNVTRCRYFEMYREMGLEEIGDLLSCQRDGDFCIGYNPDITLERQQTIMQGASHCDFRYKLCGK